MSSFVRYDFYQEESVLVLTIYVKNLSAENCDICVDSDKVGIKLKLPQKNELLEIYPFGQITPGKEKVVFKPSKIEISFLKAKKGIWDNYVRSKEDKFDNSTNENFSHYSTPQVSSADYPSSAQKKKNWDALAQEVAKDEEEEKKHLEGEDSLNNLLKVFIYYINLLK
jgi:hypothetical protein